MGLELHTGLAAPALYGVAIAACLLGLLRPAISVYFMVLLVPLQTTRYKLHDFPFGSKVVDLLLLSAIIGCLIKGWSFVPSRLNRLLILFGLFCYASLWRGVFFLDCAWPISPDDVRLQAWKNYMLMPLMFFVVVMAIREVKQMKVLLGLMCVSALYVAQSFYTSVAGRDFSHFSYSVRDSGVLGYAGENGLGAFEVEISAVLLALAFCKGLPRNARMVIWGVLACNTYCILFSYSRGAYLATLLLLFLYGLFKDRKLLVLVVLLAVGWQALVPKSVQERINMTYDEKSGTVDGSAGERLELWEDAFNLIKSNPILGTGFDTYEFMGRVGGFTDTHNYYLKVLVETGFPGLFLILFLLWRFFATGWTLFRSTEDPFLESLGFGFAAMALAVIVVNLFGDRWLYLQVNGYTWILLGCAMRGQLLANEQAQKLPEPGPAHDNQETVSELPVPAAQ